MSERSDTDDSLAESEPEPTTHNPLIQLQLSWTRNPHRPKSEYTRPPNEIHIPVLSLHDLSESKRRHVRFLLSQLKPLHILNRIARHIHQPRPELRQTPAPDQEELPRCQITRNNPHRLHDTPGFSRRHNRMKIIPGQLKQWIETIKPLIGIKHIIPPQIKSYIKIPQAPPREQIANIPCICNDPLHSSSNTKTNTSATLSQ